MRPPVPSPASTILMLRALFWIAVATAVTMALLPHPPHLPIDRLGDKFEHMLAFALLAALGSGAFPAMPLARLGERLSFLGALIEMCQSIPALHRDCDFRDWLADTLAVIGTLVVMRLCRGPADQRHAIRPPDA